MNLKRTRLIWFISFIYLQLNFANIFGDGSVPLIISIPKCGTHLLVKCFSLITNMDGRTFYPQTLLKDEYIVESTNRNEFLFGHLPFIEPNKRLVQENNIRVVFIVRDPRDAAISFAHWIYRAEKYWPVLQNIDFDEMVLKVITHWTSIFGKNEMPMCVTIDDVYRKGYLLWAQFKGVYATTFEKLVGNQGGGDDKDQLDEIKKISEHLGYNKSCDEIQYIAANLFGKHTRGLLNFSLGAESLTFRSGQIGAWKKYFKPIHKKVFKEIAGQLLIDLGYERDFNW